MTHQEIAKLRRALEGEQMAMRSRAHDEIRTHFQHRYNTIIAACESIGHEWQDERLGEWNLGILQRTGELPAKCIHCHCPKPRTDAAMRPKVERLTP